jgi:4-hydroxy-3-methylbut-2-enyl diphosphate reductase
MAIRRNFTVCGGRRTCRYHGWQTCSACLPNALGLCRLRLQCGFVAHQQKLSRFGSGGTPFEINPLTAMRVILAQPRGFCAGVVRAIELAERALERYGPPVYVRHEIVRNKHVVESPKAKGARFVEDLSEVPAHAVTIFSAHGVSGAVENDAVARGLSVLNATCPLVTKVHNQGKRYSAQGRAMILIGHAGHPEVEGTIGQMPGRVQLVQTEADVAKLVIPVDAPVAYVTQTALSVDDTRGIIAALERRFTDIIGLDTKDICYATQNRQMPVRELGRLVELNLVVGAKNSSNSNRLREIGAEAGVPSHLIADGRELNPNWLRGVETPALRRAPRPPKCRSMTRLKRCGALVPSKFQSYLGGKRPSNSGWRPRMQTSTGRPPPSVKQQAR